jgi:hypothetical protein
MNVKSLEEFKFGVEDLFNVLESDTNMKFVDEFNFALIMG